MLREKEGIRDSKEKGSKESKNQHVRTVLIKRSHLCKILCACTRVCVCVYT